MCWDKMKYDQAELMEYLKKYQEKNKQPSGEMILETISKKKSPLVKKNKVVASMKKEMMPEPMMMKPKRKLNLSPEERERRRQQAMKMNKNK